MQTGQAQNYCRRADVTIGKLISPFRVVARARDAGLLQLQDTWWPLPVVAEVASNAQSSHQGPAKATCVPQLCY